MPAVIVTALFSCVCLSACNGISVARIFYTPEPLEHTLNKVNPYTEFDVSSKTVYLVTDTSEWEGEHILNSGIVQKSDPTEYDIYDEEAHVVDYDTYVAKAKAWASVDIGPKIAQRYANTGCNFIVAAQGPTVHASAFSIIDCVYEDGKIILYGKYSGSAAATSQLTTLAIPTKLPVGTPVEWRTCYELNTSNTNSGGMMGWNTENMLDKPMIYLYPEEQTDVTVEIGSEGGEIASSYPKYSGAWHVTASPDGTLVDKNTGRNLYGLYYERKNTQDVAVTSEGFVVAGKDSAVFLEEKLAQLGLTDREAEEFIVYWLPKMENNPYNYVRFATTDEIARMLPLEVSPKPDTEIRILMFFCRLDEPITVEEQKLTAPERDGFVLVEWGGSEI